MIEPSSHYIESGSTKIHYLEWGSAAKTVVLVHGSGLCASVWDRTAKYLSSNYRVIALDLRGHGDSEKTPGHYTWPEIVSDFPEFIKALDLEEIYLVGHSRGGGVASLGGSLISQKLTGLVLIEPTLSLGRIIPKKQPNTLTLADITRKRRTEFEDLESIFSSYSKAETFKNWDPEILWSYIIGGTFQKPNGMYTLKCSPETEAVFYEENTPTYMFEELSNIKCPTLLITSENQQRFPENSIPLQSIKNSASSFEHSVVTGVGHFIPQEKPEEFNELVSNFFNNI